MYLIISDIHGNLSALRAVIKDFQKKYCENRNPIDGIICAGDLIDYGMRSNEVVEYVKQLDIPLVCNVWGNHENAIMNEDYRHFSSERGVECAKNTAKHLTEETKKYIRTRMNSQGREELIIDGKRTLVIHGSFKDAMWKALKPEDGREEFEKYAEYDLVISGHSHFPHMFEQYFTCDNPATRNKKKTIFINPGSVGQPRNINNRAQYAVIGDGRICMESVEYDIALEQSLFDGSVDVFYRNRLETGV